ARLNRGHFRRQEEGTRPWLEVRRQETERRARKKESRRQNKMHYVAAKDGRITPEQIAQEAPEVHLGLCIDNQVAACDQFIEVMHDGISADKRLRLVQIRCGAAIETAEFDRLVVVERFHAAPLNALEHLLQLPPFGTAALYKGCQVHTSSNA